MDERGWMLYVIDTTTNKKLDLSSEHACILKMGEPKTLEIRYKDYDTIDNEIQVNLGDQYVNKELNGRFLTLTPQNEGHDLISFFIPHKDDGSIIDTIEFMTFDVSD